MSKVPSNTITLLRSVYFDIFPLVERELDYWKRRAEQIPDVELKKQALASIHAKKFHCQGGGVYALLAGSQKKEAISFIVAYQTISDYLDNLCDRSTSLDPFDFELLHQAMEDALSPEKEVQNYYRLRNEQEDGGYLNELVKTCQDVLAKQENYAAIREYTLRLEGMYANLQVHKHVKVEERVPRLTDWYEANKQLTPDLSWYEFSAATGSTLGIYCLVSYLLGRNIDHDSAEMIYNSYFPYMQGLHILLDYYIDQQEDREEGDLNFCNYYRDEHDMKERFQYFIEQTKQQVEKLPNKRFHEIIERGLVALYLADEKVRHIPGSEKMRKSLIKTSGTTSSFINKAIILYEKLK